MTPRWRGTSWGSSRSRERPPRHGGRPASPDGADGAAARGERHGESLIEQAVAEARRAGCYKVSLTSNKRRSEAHRFYERLGFVQTHEAFRIDL